jgi:hypothetical protein
MIPTQADLDRLYSWRKPDPKPSRVKLILAIGAVALGVPAYAYFFAANPEPTIPAPTPHRATQPQPMAATTAANVEAQAAPEGMDTPAPVAAEDDFRLWTSDDGQTVDGRVVSVDQGAGTIVLELRDGRRFYGVRLERFRREDRDIILRQRFSPEVRLLIEREIAAHEVEPHNATLKPAGERIEPQRIEPQRFEPQRGAQPVFPQRLPTNDPFLAAKKISPPPSKPAPVKPIPAQTTPAK